MKTIFTIALSFFSMLVFSQTPGGINYQAVARDGAGALIKNKSISVKAVILSGSSGSNVEYTETHTVTTNEYGLFTAIIGEGSTVDNFGAITWGTKKHHLRIELDNGAGFVNMGTMPFQSVPYALSAKNVENMPTIALGDLSDVSASGASNGQVLGWDGSTWKPVNAGGSGTNYIGGSGITITGTTIDANAGNAIWNADEIQSRPIANTSPTNGQVLTWGGSAWTPTTPSAGNSYTAGNGLTLTGTSFSANNTTALWNASQIQGRSITNTMPGSGQVLSWNGTAWAPSTVSTGSSYTAGTGLTLTGTSFSANNTTALWNASQIQGRSITNTMPSSGQVLSWNGTAWSPATVTTGGSYTAGTGLTLTGTSFSANNTSALWNASQLQGRSVSSASPFVGQVLMWTGSSWLPTTPAAGGSAVWNVTGSNVIYTSKTVGIGTSSPISQLDVLDTITSTSQGNYVSTLTQTQGSTGSTTTSIANWTQLDGKGGYENIGVRSRVFGNSNATYNGTGGVAGYFIADCALGQNNFGVQALSGFNATATARNYAFYGHSRGDGTFNMGVFAFSDKSTGTGKTNYGIYASADSGATNYAGYFAGNVAYTGTLTGPSDARLKDNIVPFEGALDKVQTIAVKTYDFKQNGVYGKMKLPEGKQFGFIAQDLEKTFPELVENQVHALNAENNKQPTEALEYKAVNYIGMIPILTKAIQEQQEYIKTLESRLEVLENAK